MTRIEYIQVIDKGRGLIVVNEIKSHARGSIQLRAENFKFCHIDRIFHLHRFMQKENQRHLSLEIFFHSFPSPRCLQSFPLCLPLSEGIEAQTIISQIQDSLIFI